ncbi:MAG: rhodanese-like domain-containing protein [Flavobacterium sp.]|nr:rhodanese-like domain-containing protein [Pedobacter sp.]
MDGNTFKKQFKLSENVVLLDVRACKKYTSGPIPGSKNIGFMVLDFQSKTQNFDTDKTYFLLYRSGDRSGSMVKLLKKKGQNYFTRPVDLQGQNNNT